MTKQFIDHKFVARGEAVRGDVSAPITIQGTYSDFEHRPVQCIVMSDTSSWPDGFDAFNEENPCCLKGKTHDGEEIWVSKLAQVSPSLNPKANQAHWKGVAETFIKGDLDEFDATGGEFICTAYIPPTPIAVSDARCTPSSDGTITMDDSPREGVRWNTKFGMAELIDNYDYVDDKVGFDTTLIRIQRCQIVIKFEGNGLISLRDILQELPKVLDETLWLVSFLSRKRIAWYAGDLMFRPNTGPTQDFKQAIILRQSWLGYESQVGAGKSWSDLLVHPKELRKGLFRELLTNYEKSVYKKVIRRTLPYILMSYERGYLEAHIGNVYSALESLMAGFRSETDNINPHFLQPDTFNQLAVKIEQVIAEEVEDQEVAQGITKK